MNVFVGMLKYVDDRLCTWSWFLWTRWSHGQSDTDTCACQWMSTRGWTLRSLIDLLGPVFTTNNRPLSVPHVVINMHIRFMTIVKQYVIICKKYYVKVSSLFTVMRSTAANGRWLFISLFVLIQHLILRFREIRSELGISGLISPLSSQDYPITLHFNWYHMFAGAEICVAIMRNYYGLFTFRGFMS